MSATRPLDIGKKFTGGCLSSFVPPHLKKYIVPQNYKKYSSEDQAVWRFIMKGIKRNLSLYGHKGGLEGLQQTGIGQDKIPKIFDIDRELQKFGWRAICISGFIPPRAFMEFQMHKILPIASELRAIQHIFYTPAPDIVHEAVGHIPFLTNPVFSKFLEKYAQIVLKSIFSKEDMEKYKAIRNLSDLKENPNSTTRQIQKQEQKLKTIIKNISYTSEASYLSRLIWWTSEYGLMGNLKNPKIYGAGLISSIGESLHIKKVKKIKLDENCLNYPFDITAFQPQLFVAQDFEHLLDVLDIVSEKMSFRRGRAYGVDQAVKSKTLNTVVLDSGLQISGVLDKTIKTKTKNVVFLKFSGPVQLSFQNKQLQGHGAGYHREGYSTPLKFLTKSQTPFHLWTAKEMQRQGLKKDQTTKMLFEGGIRLEGVLEHHLKCKGRLLLLSFKNCLIRDRNNSLLYHPSWGPFDLAVGSFVTSVFSGPADGKAYKQEDDFEPSKIQKKTSTKKQKETFKIYRKIANLKMLSNNQLQKLLKELKKQKNAWLMLLELLDFARNKVELKKHILDSLDSIEKTKLQNREVFKLGKDLYQV